MSDLLGGKGFLEQPFGFYVLGIPMLAFCVVLALGLLTCAAALLQILVSVWITWLKEIFKPQG